MIRPLYVQSFPKTLENGILYISREFGTACHLCCCGCGAKIVTPLRPTEYRLSYSDGRVSLFPSIGNWNHPCKSHYLIHNGRVTRARAMDQLEIDEGRVFDEAEKHAYFLQSDHSWLIRMWNAIKSVFAS